MFAFSAFPSFNGGPPELCGRTPGLAGLRSGGTARNRAGCSGFQGAARVGGASSATVRRRDPQGKALSGVVLLSHPVPHVAVVVVDVASSHQSVRVHWQAQGLHEL